MSLERGGGGGAPDPSAVVEVVTALRGRVDSGVTFFASGVRHGRSRSFPVPRLRWLWSETHAV
jgi:hypothetical protein